MKGDWLNKLWHHNRGPVNWSGAYSILTADQGKLDLDILASNREWRADDTVERWGADADRVVRIIGSDFDTRYPDGQLAQGDPAVHC